MKNFVAIRVRVAMKGGEAAFIVYSWEDAQTFMLKALRVRIRTPRDEPVTVEIVP